MVPEAWLLAAWMLLDDDARWQEDHDRIIAELSAAMRRIIDRQAK